MSQTLALIGFGEAARTFAEAGGWGDRARAWDIKTREPAHREAKLADYEASGVHGCENAEEALRSATLVLSLVTADQTGAAAREAIGSVASNSLYCDMNSAAPDTKREAARAIEASDGRYVDVAIMAPVAPQRLSVPLLVAGPHAEDGACALQSLGFTNVTVAGARVGDASAIKMIRSVMVKGMEALTAECVLAAGRAGVTESVLASLGGDWPARADYNVERMLAHGLRRAAEMEEAAATLEALGVDPLMTRGTIARQRALGALAIHPVPEGLAAKLAAVEEGCKAP